MFTKEQIEEIRRKLAVLGIKDTDFDDANDLTFNEYVAIIQEGRNKKVTLNELVSIGEAKGIIHGATFVYEQAVASDYWYVVHDLHKFPSVTVVDTGRNKIEGAVNYIDENILEIRFEIPVSGKAYLN